MSSLAGIKTILDIFNTTYTSFQKLSLWTKYINRRYDFTNASQEYKRSLEERYSKIKIFGMHDPIELRSLFTRVNILEKITARQRITIEELAKKFDRDKRSFGNPIAIKDGVKVLDSYSKLIVLGKPGAGKTTFLKHILLQAIDGQLRKKLIPIFVSLKNWSDSNQLLKEYIVKQFDICKLPQAEPFIEHLLEKGNAIVLFDGLDEVNIQNEDRIVREVSDFTDKYSKNKFLISCRLASYNHCFDKFTDVEVADFNDEQIKIFIDKWFWEDHETAELCFKEINQDPGIRELASIPLLLTMLCLVFDETMSFPKNRAELYKEAIDALLKKWDSSRRINRGEIYKGLSLLHKESMFSRIAATTFEKGQYFIPQRTLENHIAIFIKHLPESKEEVLVADSEAILKAIEAQHGIFVERAYGIYSFAHLTFQEYFTAKYIVDNAENGAIRRLIDEHLTDRKWNEIFLLLSGILPDANNFILLMKAKIDSLIDDQFARFLNKIFTDPQYETYIQSKSYLKPLTLSHIRLVKIGLMIDVNKGFDISKIRESDLPIDFHKAKTNYNIILNLKRSGVPDLSNLLVLCEAYTAGYCAVASSEVHSNTISNDSEEIDLEKSYKLFIARTLNLYLNSYRLLLKCINSECYITKETRQKILDDLLTIPAKYQQPQTGH